MFIIQIKISQAVVFSRLKNFITLFLFLSSGRSMSEKRIVRDCMGELEVDTDALFGAQTQRAVKNFPISGIKMPETFVRALQGWLLLQLYK